MSTEVLSVLAKLDGDARGMVNAFDQAGRAVKDAETRSAAAAAVMKGAFAATAVAIGAVVTSAAALYKVGSIFDEVTDTIITATGASGDALASLEASAQQVGLTTPAAFSDIGVAIGELNTRLGLTGAPLEDMTKRMLDLARVTGGDVQSTIAQTTRVFGDWGVAVEDQAAVMDTLFAASQATGIGVDALSTKVVQFGAPLRNLGISLEEGIAMLGKWEKEGVNVDTVMAGLKIGVSNLARTTDDIPGAFRAAVESIQGMESASEGTAKAIEIFGSRAGPDMAAAIREGRFEIDELVAQLGTMEGALGDAAARTMDFPEAFQLFKNAALTAFEPVGTAVFGLASDGMMFLADAMADLAPVIQSAMESAAPFIENLGGTLAELAGPAMQVLSALSPLGTMLKALEPVLPAIGEMFATIGGVLAGALSSALPVITSLMGQLTEVLSGVLASVLPVIAGLFDHVASALELVLPVVMEVAGVIGGALITVLESLAPVLPVIMDALMGVLDAVMPLIEPVLGLVTALLPLVEVAGELIATVLPPLISLMVGMLEPILALVSPLLDLLVPALDVVAWVLGLVADAVSFVIGWLGDLLADAGVTGEGVGATFEQMADVIGAVVGGIGDFIAWLVESFQSNFDRVMTIVRTVGDVFGSVFGAIGGFIEDAFVSAVSVVRGAVNGIISLVNGVVDAINAVSITIPDWVPFLGGQTFGVNLPQIPMLAEGGRALAPGLALVGERGPEVLKLPQGAVVAPLDGSVDFGDEPRGDVNVTIVVEGHVLNDGLVQELTEKVGERVRFVVMGGGEAA
jgi:TP901 family phage tail tape measure protein